MRLTGKQQAFLAEYLGPANFNATLAAQRAGYRATSKHSFESIGSENLTRPAIKAAIDEHFKAAHMSAEEVLQELSQLARGTSRDKIKALSLLAAHNGLLDGSWVSRSGQSEVVLRVEYETNQRINAAIHEVEKDVAKYDQEQDQKWRAVRARFVDQPAVVRALDFLRDVMAGKAEVDIEQAREPEIVEPEIIPPQRRLHAAPVEKMMEAIDVEPATEREKQNLPIGKISSHTEKQNGDEYNDVIINERGEKVYQFGKAARPKPNDKGRRFLIA
jgi:phage terminase small subunit